MLLFPKGKAAISSINLLGAFPFFFIILSALLPLYISSYGIVGEKTEKNLEPLLATPTSDGEILMGKCIGSFLPVLVSIYDHLSRKPTTQVVG